jgi:pimeloyl-ACP methyl ester carboxylesterase
MTATDQQRRQALATAFAPGTPVPDQLVADLRAIGRQRLVAASRAIDTYLAEAPLADRLDALDVPVDLVFGEQDQRVTPPPHKLFTHHNTTLMRGVGHTPPWEAPERIAELILTAERHPESRSTTQLETR